MPSIPISTSSVIFVCSVPLLTSIPSVALSLRTERMYNSSSKDTKATALL